MNDSLDEAWREAQGALRAGTTWAGWRIEGIRLVDTSDDEDLSVERLEWEAEASGDRGQRSINGLGPTPAAALLALAVALEATE